MKTKEELLKIYSAYLPYQLEMQYQESEQFGILQSILCVDDSDDARLGISNMFQSDHYWLFKPILYSMDMLTKEIEHKRERFIPVHYLMKMRSVNPDSFCCDTRKQKAIDALLNDLKITNRISIDMFNKLLDWNFNVFGLDESEYIKK